MTRTLYIIDGSAPARTAWMACVAAGVDVDIHRMDTLEKANQWEEWFLQVREGVTFGNTFWAIPY